MARMPYCPCVEVKVRLLMVDVVCSVSVAVSIVSIPNRLRLLIVPSPAPGLLVTVFPIGMVTSSVAPGTPFGDQFPAVFQSVVPALPVKVLASACANIGARRKIPTMTTKIGRRFTAPSPKNLQAEVTHGRYADAIP